MYTPHQFELANGLRVVVVERSLSPTFAAALTYGAGSYDDPPNMPGVAHFSEHLAFRGPNRALVEGLARLGSSVNAWTGTDYTQFFSSGPVEQLRTALGFFSNVLAIHRPSHDDFANEREVFGHELRSSRDNGARQAALNRYWGATLGDANWHTRPRRPASRIRALTAETVDSWRHAHLPVSSARCAIVSALTIDELKPLLEESLSQVAPRENAAAAAHRCHPLPHRQITISWDIYKYVWIYLTHVVALTDPITRLTARILSDYLGAGPDSQLFRRLRSDCPLAYNVHSTELPNQRTTAVSSHATVQRSSLRQAIGIMLKCLDDVRNRRIEEAQFSAIKNRLSKWSETWIDNPGTLAAFLAYESLRPETDAVICPAQFSANLAKINIDEFNVRASSLLAYDNRYCFVGGRLGLIARFLLHRQLRDR